MKKTKILSLGLAALLGIGVFSAAMVTSTQRDNCLEVNAASITDSLNPNTTLYTTTSGRFMWNRMMTTTTTQVWTSGAVYCSFANNQTFTVTWTVPDGYQVIKVRPFYNILTTTDWKDTYKLKSTVTCGDYSETREDTIAHYPVLRLTDSGRTPQHANVSFTIKNVSGYTGNLAFDTGEIFEIEYELMTAAVTLDKQSGTGGTNSFNVKYGNNMPTVAVPTRTNYRFEGYYDAISGGKKYINADGSSATTWDKSVTSATLYARWTLLQFDVTLDQCGGTGGTELVQATLGQPMPSATMPTRTGYTFNGYYDATSGGTKYYNADGSSANNYDKESSTTLYADWSANEYKATFNPGVGTGGLTQLDVTYDSNLPDLTAEQIPSLAPSGNHSYSFGGYFTEQPTPNGDGSYTPHGKQYYDKDGKGLEAWHEASDTTLYAYYTVDMEVTSSGYSGTWDGENHGISVNVNFPEGTTTYYGDSASSCNNPNASDFLKSEAGTYDIYYEVRLVGYTPFPGHETIIINKAGVVVDPTPQAVTGLKYTSEAQTLITAGTADFGTMQYAVNTTGTLPEESEFSDSLPTGTNVGTYYVFYRSTGDSNHNPTTISTDNMIVVTISRVNRTNAINTNNKVKNYLNTLDDRFDSIKNDLESYRSTFEAEAITQDNITAADVATKVSAMEAKLSEAKVAVTEQLINAIGEVKYSESKDAIEEAYAYYSEVLNETEKGMVDPTLVELLNTDKTQYDHVDYVANLINAIPTPSATTTYYTAVDAAYNAYLALDDDEEAIINASTDKDFEVILINHVKAREVIEDIANIGKLTYNGGTNDSLALIISAETKYSNLTPAQKEIVNIANYSTLTLDREIYDSVDNVVKTIALIGKVEHTDESKAKIDAARSAYDGLVNEEAKELVKGYNNSYKTLDDAEHVYQAMVYIDDIGNVAYDTDPEDRIAKAREYYDSLTEDQKAQLGDTYYKLLTDSEDESREITRINTIWLIVGLSVSGLIIIAGFFFILWLFKKKKNDDENEGNKSKKEPVKLMSISGIIPGIILISHYLDAPWIILYVIAPIALLVLIASIILFVLKKQGKLVKKVEPKQIQNDVVTSEDEEEVETITDEKGNVFQIRFIKSFTAKLIQSPEETKKYYEELKNEVLSYKKTNSRISWHYDAVNSGREYVLKFAVRGKTLCVYLPLNADDYADSKYKVEKAESKRYEDVPCLYRIKNDRRLGYAKELIAVVAANLGLEKGEEQHEVYSNLPYEPNKPLVSRGLIKEQKIQVNKPATEPVVLETKTNSDGDEVVLTKDASGNIFEIRYIKSFTAKLSQSEDVVKDYYTELKNYVLSYKDTHSRVSWHYDAVNIGRDYVLKFVIRGKTLCVYYALDASQVDEKYKVEDAKGKKFIDVPCLYRIKNDRRLGYAKELIDLLMNRYAYAKT